MCGEIEMPQNFGDASGPRATRADALPEPASGLGHSVTPPIAYPVGAIRDPDELAALYEAGLRVVFDGSKEFGASERPLYINGKTGVEVHKDGWRYEWFECRSYDEAGSYRRRSLRDMHLLPQTYNDWFLFTDLVLAQAYAAQGMEARQGGDAVAAPSSDDSPVPEGDAP
jgi:hypothetical protein